MEEAAEGEDMGGLFGDDYGDEEYCGKAVMMEADIKPQWTWDSYKVLDKNRNSHLR
jgi:hypothetical protein